MADIHVEDSMNIAAAKRAQAQVGHINTTVYPPAMIARANSVPRTTSTGVLSDGWTGAREEVCCDGIASVDEVEVVNYYKITLSEYQRLLGKVMDALDAAVPNKQQHAAATRIARKAFDAAYHDMLRDFGGCGSLPLGAYAVEPIR